MRLAASESLDVEAAEDEEKEDAMELLLPARCRWGGVAAVGGEDPTPACADAAAAAAALAAIAVTVSIRARRRTPSRSMIETGRPDFSHSCVIAQAWLRLATSLTRLPRSVGSRTESRTGDGHVGSDQTCRGGPDSQGI